MAPSILESVDLFAATKVKEERTSSWVSIFGSFAALALLLSLSVVQLISYSKHERTISPSTIPRNESMEIPVPPFGLMVYTEGDVPFYNESFFRWQFDYRSVFYGNARKDDPTFASQKYTIPARSCELYYDLVKVKSRVVPNVTTGGKPAKMGCLDWDAVSEILDKQRKNGTLEVRPGGHLQGKYGERSYWWVQATLMDCSRYGKKAGIPCATQAELQKLFSKPMTVDFVSLDQLTPDAFTWGNIYMNLNLDLWTGYEVFFRAITYKESNKELPSLWAPTSTAFSKMDSFTPRTSARVDTYVTFYVRLAPLVDELRVGYFSFEDVLTKIGSWERILWMIIGTVCIYFNIYYAAGICCRSRQVPDYGSSSSEMTDTPIAEVGHAVYSPDAIKKDASTQKLVAAAAPSPRPERLAPTISPALEHGADDDAERIEECTDECGGDAKPAEAPTPAITRFVPSSAFKKVRSSIVAQTRVDDQVVAQTRVDDQVVSTTEERAVVSRKAAESRRSSLPIPSKSSEGVSTSAYVVEIRRTTRASDGERRSTYHCEPLQSSSAIGNASAPVSVNVISPSVIAQPPKDAVQQPHSSARNTYPSAEAANIRRQLVQADADTRMYQLSPPPSRLQASSRGFDQRDGTRQGERRDAAYAREYDGRDVGYDAREYQARDAAYPRQYEGWNDAYPQHYGGRQEAYPGDYQGRQQAYPRDYQGRDSAYLGEYQGRREAYPRDYEGREVAYPYPNGDRGSYSRAQERHVPVSPYGRNNEVNQGWRGGPNSSPPTPTSAYQSADVVIGTRQTSGILLGAYKDVTNSHHGDMSPESNTAANVWRQNADAPRSEELAWQQTSHVFMTEAVRPSPSNVSLDDHTR